MAETTTKTVSKPATKKTTVKPAAVDASSKKPVAAKKATSAKRSPIVPTTPEPTEAIKSISSKAASPKTASSKVTASKAMVVTGEQRYRMVAEAAYYRAERNQFKSDPLRDWIEAENDIATLLSGNS